MGRTRDVSKILTSNTSILSLASASATYAPVASGGLVQLLPVSVTTASGSSSVSSTGLITFTDASSVSINNIFRSEYKNYFIIGSAAPTTSSTRTINVRMRSGTTDATGGNYHFGLNVRDSSNTALSAGNFSQTSAVIIRNAHYATQNHVFNFNLYDPFETKNTIGLGSHDGGTASYDEFGTVGFVHAVGTSYNGITFISSVTNITGQISIYGYKN